MDLLESGLNRKDIATALQIPAHRFVVDIVGQVFRDLRGRFGDLLSVIGQGRVTAAIIFLCDPARFTNLCLTTRHRNPDIEVWA